MEKRIHSFFQGMGMGVNSFFKSRNEEWELIPFFKKEWEWDYNPKNQGMDPCLRISKVGKCTAFQLWTPTYLLHD